MSEFDQYSSSYHASINQALFFQTHDFYTRAKAAWLRTLIRASGKVRPGVLDVGCGHGDIHRYLADLDCRITGIEPATTVVEEARARNPGVQYDSYDGTRLPYPDAAFDFTYTICVLHHVPPAQWPAFVAEMHRVTAPGGAVVVFEHNPFNPLTQRFVRGCEIDRDAVLLRAAKVRDLFTGTGLEVAETRYILFTPFAAAPFKWLDRALGWLPLGAQYFVAARR